MKNKFFITLFACLLPWMAGAQQTISKQNNVAEKDYIAYLFTYLQVTTSARKPYAMR
mgnify:CR=1 FL=1